MSRPNFAVLCKGKSLERLHLIADKFDDCFIVNHWENELKEFGHLLKGKRIVQFVNRRGTIRMSKSVYDEYGITQIQYNLPEFISRSVGKNKSVQFLEPQKTAEVDKKTSKRLREYGEFGLNLHYLPPHILAWNEFFDPFVEYKGEYTYKHPNTGVQACIYAADVVEPKNLYVIGLDFYYSDYWKRRTESISLTKQQAKMERCHMVDHFRLVVEYYKDINWNIVTEYKDLVQGYHVTLL